MRYTLANTAESLVIITYRIVTLHLLLLQTEFSVQPAEWQHPYSCDTVALYI